MAKSISIRRAPASAYNPQRPMSDLLRAHIRNLEAVTGRTTAPGPKRKPKTEAQASAYIAELTRQIPNLTPAADAPAAGYEEPAAAEMRIKLARPRRPGAARSRRKTTKAARKSRAKARTKVRKTQARPKRRAKKASRKSRY